MSDIKHKIGDKVVAITTTENTYSQPRIKGEVYIIKDVHFCSNCGAQYVNFGYDVKVSFGKCTTCDASQPTRNLRWTPSNHYINICDIDLLMKSAISKEDYEFAAILRDINNSILT